MNFFRLRSIFFCFAVLLGGLVLSSRVEGATTLYFNNFGTTTISGATYTGVPTLDAAVTTAVWTTSASGFTSFAGSSGQALSLSNSGGTPTITLTLTLDALYTLDLASLSFWRQRSAAGAQNWSLSVNGTAVNSGTVPTTGASTGTLTPSTTAFGGSAGLSQYTFQFSLSGASGTGTFRLDDFLLTGTFAAPVVAGSELYWRGSDTVRGGPGTWSNADASWFATDADGGTNLVWDSTKKAIFGGTGDTVTVSGTVAAAAGMEFQSTGYTVTGGDAINLTGATPAENIISTATGVTASIATNITGSNGMTKAGAGTLVLTGDKTYTGGTTISGGILQLGDGTINGSVAGNVTNNANLTFNNGSTQTFGGEISGTGSLTKLGTGALTLSGSNNYSGGTTVSAGSLIGTTTSLQGNITNHAAVTFDQGSDGTYAGNMTGSGSLTKSGAGNVTLSGTNSYSGGTTVSAGTLTGTTSSLQGAITNDASVAFDQASNGTYAGNMTGSGSLTKTGAGVVTLSGTNDYSGGTTVSGGGLVGTTDSLQGAITNNAAVTFNQTTDGTYAGIMTGTGSLTKSGTGAVTLSGGNDYSGGTTVTGGTLIAAHNTALGSGDVDVTGAALLAAAGVTIANTITVDAAGADTLVAYWNFNALSIATASAPGSGGVPLTIAADQGSGTLSLANWTGLVDDFGGDSINALSPDLAGVSLSLISNAGNDSYIQISGLDLTGLSDAQVTFATRGTSTGFSTGQWSYSTDGTSFTNFGSSTATTSTTFALANPGTTSGLDDTATGFLRYTLSGASNASGNNRIDNLQITATGTGASPVLGSDITSGTATYSGNITLDSNVNLTAAAGGTTRFTGIIANGSNGARGIEKVGAGLVEVTGANTYSGPTMVTAGILAVNNTTGSGTGTGNVLVKDTAVLAGSGTLSPATGGSVLFEDGSTVSVGNVGDVAGQQLRFIPDSGTITTTFRSGSKLEFDLFSNVGDNSSITAAADRLFLDGTAVFEANVTLKVNTTLNALDFLEGDRWRLLDWSSLSVTGNPNDLTLDLPALSGSLTWNTSQLFTTGNITIVPEPSRALLAALGLLALALRRRRVQA